MSQKFDVIIIGGGIIGCSVAYHIALQGKRRVAVLERSKLTSGTTWHAAGLVAEMRASANLTRLAKYSGSLYESLQDAGEPLGYKRVGALTLAKNADRRYELQKLAAMARGLDVACDWLEAAAIRERWPHLHTDDLVGGVYMPNDGQTNPVDTTLALARQAKKRGVEIFEDTAVEEILHKNGVAHGVQTAQGTWEAEQVLICGGLWSRELALSAGVNVPLYPAEHFYAVTEAVSLSGDQPIVRVPDDGVYLKPDAGRMLIGCFENTAKPLDPTQLPVDFSFGELPFDLDHFAPYLESALARIPSITQTGIRTWFNGPESFTPDGRYLLGESPQMQQLFVAAGFNSIGIQSAGGVGQVMAQWLANRRPPMDLWEVDIRRFSPLHNQTDYLVNRTSESLGLLYAMHWPYYQNTSARDQRQSPLHDRLQQQGACFGELAGWERPNWYSTPGSKPEYNYSHAKQNWFENAAHEHHAVRTDVALFDQTSFAKYQVSGTDACRFLNHLSTANLDVADGRIVYCQWLNDQAGIEADVTITRISTTEFLVVSAAASTTRDMHWMNTHRPPFEVDINDVTEQFAVLGIMGPQARTHLQGCTPTTLDNQAQPFGHSQIIKINDHAVRASRITYVGELGWELYIPWDNAASVYQALTATPIVHAGYHAMDSLRIEKAYRHWGHDITDEDTPVEAGLSFTADFDKPNGFIGREILLQQKSDGVNKRLVLFQLDDPDIQLTHDEPIWRDGKISGHITSSAYSHQFGAALGFGYVTADTRLTRTDLLQSKYAIEIADRKITALPHLKAMYDPTNDRILQ